MHSITHTMSWYAVMAFWKKIRGSIHQTLLFRLIFYSLNLKVRPIDDYFIIYATTISCVFWDADGGRIVVYRGLLWAISTWYMLSLIIIIVVGSPQHRASASVAAVAQDDNGKLIQSGVLWTYYNRTLRFRCLPQSRLLKINKNDGFTNDAKLFWLSANRKR